MSDKSTDEIRYTSEEESGKVYNQWIGATTCYSFDAQPAQEVFNRQIKINDLIDFNLQVEIDLSLCIVRAYISYIPEMDKYRAEIKEFTGLFVEEMADSFFDTCDLEFLYGNGQKPIGVLGNE